MSSRSKTDPIFEVRGLSARQVRAVRSEAEQAGLSGDDFVSVFIARAMDLTQRHRAKSILAKSDRLASRAPSPFNGLSEAEIGQWAVDLVKEARRSSRPAKT
jgi:hypothetical protein